MILHPKGTKIICPQCRHEVTQAARDICVGDEVLAEQWEGMKPCQPTTCPECGASYMRFGQVHTEKGWI